MKLPDDRNEQKRRFPFLGTGSDIARGETITSSVPTFFGAIRLASSSRDEEIIAKKERGGGRRTRKERRRKKQGAKEKNFSPTTNRIGVYPRSRSGGGRKREYIIRVEKERKRQTKREGGREKKGDSTALL